MTGDSARRAGAGGSPSRAAAIPALMVQGTCSNAGKSLLAAAFCRIYARRGLRVRPFKAQNMALNSFVTGDGGEMGRAQALQAAAARCAPDVRMNPVLLKPSSETGSQVIVLGQPVGQMRVAEYFRYKPQAWQAVVAAYDSLAAEADLMVLEGAGSPAEINLKAHDIVNMRMALHAGARVLLAADIDRGGSFAALVGTLALLEPEERALVRGLVLNKFRGDAGLLAPALESIAARTGKPFVGVVPWLHGLRLPEEDSVAFKLQTGGDPAAVPQGVLDIALVDMPHISNFTDADALRCEPDVRLRVVRDAAALGVPDVLLLPGSRNTIADLRWLKRTGLAEAILKLARSGGCAVAGICGGLQMMGRAVRDPLGLECGGEEEGLGLLPLETTLGGKKVLTRRKATHVPTGEAVDGYEIHHGVTLCRGPEKESVRPAVVAQDGAVLGWTNLNLPVWGTYLHGIFDTDAFRRRWLDGVRAAHGLPPVTQVTEYSLEPGLERLADAVESALDMTAIDRMLEL